MDWSGKKVLVTGADGFIGSHLTEALVENDADVTALAHYNSFDSHGWLDEVPQPVRRRIRLERGDIREANQMAVICRGQDVVFHLAALISIPYSYSAPSVFIDTNVTGTMNVLAAARDGGAGRVINTSTSEVYGTAQFTPISEDHPLQGQSPYSASKIGAAMMAEAFARSFELPVVTLRPFNTYGPRQSERAIISTVIRQILDPACKEIRVGDRRPGRAFSYVADTVSAFLAVADLAPDHPGRTFNAGVDRMETIGDLIEILLGLAGCDKPVVEEPERLRPASSEVMALVADASRLCDATGWRPLVELEDGLGRTIAWWRGRMKRVRPDAAYMT